MITIREHATALQRAHDAFHTLEHDPRRSRQGLGTARDHLNRVRNLADPDQIHHHVTTLETLAAEVRAAAEPAVEAADEPCPS